MVQTLITLIRDALEELVVQHVVRPLVDGAMTLIARGVSWLVDKVNTWLSSAEDSGMSESVAVRTLATHLRDALAVAAARLEVVLEFGSDGDIRVGIDDAFHRLASMPAM